jgi:prevent-host-death family protein
MKVINVQEAKTHLSRLIDAAVEGEDIILGKHGKPLVRLSSFVATTEPRRLGGREGEIHIAADFDEEDDRINAIFR